MELRELVKLGKLATLKSIDTKHRRQRKNGVKCCYSQIESGPRSRKVPGSIQQISKCHTHVGTLA